MTGVVNRPRLIVLLALAALVAVAAAPVLAQQESGLGADFRNEAESVKADCKDVKTIASCGSTVVTDSPLHVALGSIAPQNGFGIGAAFVADRPVGESLRLGWSADAVHAFGGAWRAGAYMKIVRTAVALPTPVGPGGGSDAAAGIHPYPIFYLYAQAISLPTISYYGLGPATAKSDKASFGFRESIVGANTIYPLAGAGRLNLALLGEANGRFVSVLGAQASDAPSIEQRYSDVTAPGLSTQPNFLQFGEGVRIKPSLGNGHLRLNYMAKYQEFVASDSTFSFRRWTLDLSHEVPLYRTQAPPLARDANGPNECATSPETKRCPPLLASHDRTGTIGVRLLASKSMVSSGAVVPFYFQQTVGGSDINGARILPSYDDYRFRGPHLVVLQETLEHSLYGPVGLWLAADQGKVAQQEDGLNFSGLLHSYAAGLTLRAGGIPAVVFSYAVGGTEGHHIAFTVSTSLLGGSPRPFLY